MPFKECHMNKINFSSLLLLIASLCFGSQVFATDKPGEFPATNQPNKQSLSPMPQPENKQGNTPTVLSMPPTIPLHATPSFVVNVPFTLTQRLTHNVGANYFFVFERHYFYKVDPQNPLKEEEHPKRIDLQCKPELVELVGTNLWVCAPSKFPGATSDFLLINALTNKVDPKVVSLDHSVGYTKVVGEYIYAFKTTHDVYAPGHNLSVIDTRNRQVYNIPTFIYGTSSAILVDTILYVITGSKMAKIDTAQIEKDIKDGEIKPYIKPE